MIKNKEEFPSPKGEEGYIVAGNHISLRDYFASQALSGILSNFDPEYSESRWQSVVSIAAYVLADEMLKAREQTDDS